MGRKAFLRLAASLSAMANKCSFGTLSRRQGKLPPWTRTRLMLSKAVVWLGRSKKISSLQQARFNSTTRSLAPETMHPSKCDAGDQACYVAQPFGQGNYTRRAEKMLTLVPSL